MAADAPEGTNQDAEVTPPGAPSSPTQPIPLPATRGPESVTEVPPLPEPTPASAPSSYQLVEELGRGAMGVVYRAHQVSLKRDVALKMILAGSHAGEQERQRFLAEAQAAATLHHPGIVHVYELGICAGLPYFAMEFCPGGSLARKLSGKPLAAHEAAQLLEQVARAVQAAHDKGIIHRDLKPGNILLTADGTPKVADFGLARRAEGGSGTVTGTVMGTPAYMAPEQARGQKDVGPPADIYALGAILYECLTGRPPFQGSSTHDLLLRVVAEEPPAPSRIEPAADRVLEAICLKCLEKDPARRYGSARQMGDELRRFLAGERPTAGSPARRRGRRWLAAVLAALLLAGLLAAGWLVPGLAGLVRPGGTGVPPAGEGSGPVAGLAREIARLLEEETQSGLAVGDFADAPERADSGGDFRRRLVEELQKRDVKIDPDASLVVEGELLPPDEANEGGARVELTVRTRTGKALVHLCADVEE